MEEQKTANTNTSSGLTLSVLCRFLAARMLYRFMLLLLSGTGIVLSLLKRSQFAPYGIALICLLLPIYLNSASEQTKKENSDTALPILYKRYHYSPVSFASYRRMLSLGILMLFLWYGLLRPSITLFGISLPLFYAALLLAGYPILSRILIFLFHRRLMNGTM